MAREIRSNSVKEHTIRSPPTEEVKAATVPLRLVRGATWDDIIAVKLVTNTIINGLIQSQAGDQPYWSCEIATDKNSPFHIALAYDNRFS